MMRKIYNSTEFQVNESIFKNQHTALTSNIKFSHDLMLGTFKNDNRKIWVAKKISKSSNVDDAKSSISLDEFAAQPYIPLESIKTTEPILNKTNDYFLNSNNVDSATSDLSIWLGERSDTNKDDTNADSCSNAAQTKLATAELELLAQEFFRFFLRYQPETRLMQDEHTKTLYVLSEKIKNFRCLPTNDSPKPLTNLGQVLLLARLVEEIDLKNGNIGLNDQDEVTKIDGDNCFSYVKKPDGFKKFFDLTPASLEDLIYIDKRPVHNWLDFVIKGKKYPGDRLVNKASVFYRQFRREINILTLKFCLMPDKLIQSFVNVYVTIKLGEDIISLFITSRDVLKAGALNEASFKTFLTTPEANNIAKDYLNSIQDFKHDDTYLFTGPVLAEITAQLDRQLELFGFKFSSLQNPIPSVMVHSSEMQALQPNRFFSPSSAKRPTINEPVCCCVM